MRVLAFLLVSLSLVGHAGARRILKKQDVFEPEAVQEKEQSMAGLVEELEAHMEGEKHHLNPEMKAPQKDESSETAHAPRIEPELHEALSTAELQAQAGADFLKHLEEHLEGEKHHLSPEMKAPHRKEEESSKTAHAPRIEPELHEALSKAELQAQAGADFIKYLEEHMEGEKHQLSPEMKAPCRKEEESSKTAHAPRIEPELHEALSKAEMQAQAGADFIKHLEEHMEGEKHHLRPEMNAPRRKEEESSETARAPRIEPELHEALSTAELQAQAGTDFAKHLEEHMEGEKHHLSPEMKAPQPDASSEIGGVPRIEPQLHEALSKADLLAQSWSDLVEKLEEHMEGEKHHLSPHMKATQKDESSETAADLRIEPELHDMLSKAEVLEHSLTDFVEELEAHMEDEKRHLSPQMKAPQAKDLSEESDAPRIEPQLHEILEEARQQAHAVANLVEELEAQVEGEKHHSSPHMKAAVREPPETDEPEFHDPLAQ